MVETGSLWLPLRDELMEHRRQPAACGLGLLATLHEPVADEEVESLLSREKLDRVPALRQLSMAGSSSSEQVILIEPRLLPDPHGLP
jgi:hypothetical protein